MKRVRTAVGVVLALGLFVSSGADATESSPSQPVLSPSTQRFAERPAQWNSIHEAIEAGVLDAKVVRTLERRGSTKALVEFDADAKIGSLLVDGSPQLQSVRRSLSDLPRELRVLKSAALASEGVSTLTDYRYLPTSLIKVTSTAALLRLLNTDRVQAVRHDALQEVSLTESLSAIGQPAAVEAGFGGAGAAVVVLDSGVDYKRAAFGGCSSPGVPLGCKVIASRDFAPGDGRLDTGNFHGTNVSAIVAGVAPDAKLLVGDVMTRQGIKDSWGLKGIDWAMANKAKGVDVRAVNMSFGASYSYWNKPCYSSNYTSAFRTARSVGILPVVSAGNHGFDWHLNHGFHPGVSMPACTPGAVSVGAVYDSDIGKERWPVAGGFCVDRRTSANKVTCWTQSGKTVGLFAPGAYITAAGIKMPGTSQAAPHVAGAAAVLGAAYPGASTVQIETALKTSGPKVYDPGPQITRRRLDIPAALDTLLAGLETTPPAVIAPVQFLPEGVDVIPPNVPVAVQWSATDASGIYEYVLQIAEDGIWYTLDLETRSSTQVLLDLTPGKRYQFGVAARDKAGNWSDWAYGPEFVPQVYQEDNSAISYSDGWERLAWSQAWDGYQVSSVTPEASNALSFAGMDVAWVGTIGPDNGFADFLIDGVVQNEVDTFNWDAAPRLLLAARHWDSAGPHTVGLRVLGDGQIDVDAFIVLRP